MFADLKMLPYEERLRRLCLWFLEERRNRAELLELYKMIEGFFLLFHGLSVSLGRMPALPVVIIGSYRKGITYQTFGFISFLNAVSIAGTASVKMLSTLRV